MLWQRTLSSSFALIIILGIRLYGMDDVFHQHLSLSVLIYPSIFPTCSPLADISKWIGLRSSLTFSNSCSDWTDVMAMPPTKHLLVYCFMEELVSILPRPLHQLRPWD